MYYQFYCETPSMEVIYKKMKPSNVHLYQDSKTAYYKETIRITNYDYSSAGYWINVKNKSKRSVIKREIHVPKGTVKQGYGLDLK